MIQYEYATSVITHGLLGRKEDELDRPELDASSTGWAPTVGSSPRS